MLPHVDVENEVCEADQPERLAVPAHDEDPVQLLLQHQIKHVLKRIVNLAGSEGLDL